MDTSASADPKGGSSSLTMRTFDQIRSDILTGKLKPGVKLGISALKERYGTGPTPIREALSLLSSGTLIERIDQRGFRVRPISRHEFDELLKTRCWLEEVALRQSIRNGSGDWHESLVVTAWRLSREKRAEAGSESNSWEALHKSFHMQLLAKCGSSFLLDTCSQLYDLNIRYRYVARSGEPQKRDVASEHNAIVEAATAREEDRAVELLIAHYQQTAGLLRGRI